MNLGLSSRVTMASSILLASDRLIFVLPGLWAGPLQCFVVDSAYPIRFVGSLLRVSVSIELNWS